MRSLEIDFSLEVFRRIKKQAQAYLMVEKEKK